MAGSRTEAPISTRRLKFDQARIARVAKRAPEGSFVDQSDFADLHDELWRIDALYKMLPDSEDSISIPGIRVIEQYYSRDDWNEDRVKRDDIAIEILAKPEALEKVTDWEAGSAVQTVLAVDLGRRLRDSGEVWLRTYSPNAYHRDEAASVRIQPSFDEKGLLFGILAVSYSPVHMPIQLESLMGRSIFSYLDEFSPIDEYIEELTPTEKAFLERIGRGDAVAGYRAYNQAGSKAYRASVSSAEERLERVLEHKFRPEALAVGMMDLMLQSAKLHLEEAAA